jgi:hypothetical protein
MYRNMKIVSKNYTIVATAFICVLLLVSMLLVHVKPVMAAGALTSVFVKPSTT